MEIENVSIENASNYNNLYSNKQAHALVVITDN